MTHVRPGHFSILCATLLVLVFGSACGDRRTETDHYVRFVQLTDPHFFLDTSKDSDPAKKAVRVKQEELDQNAVSDFWKQIPSLGGDQPISFLVITGDLGVEPCSFIDTPANAKPEDRPKAKDCIEKASTVNKDKRASQITKMADLFGASPVRDIYVAAGNNDIASEVASDDALDYFDEVIGELQKKLDESKKNVQLHILTGCYSSKGGSCYADVAETSYRLIGFPSYSFKNREPGSDTNTALQEKQLETFSTLLDQARQAGKKVLVVSHVPLMDDPYTMAQDRYAGATPPAAVKDAADTRSTWSTWNVTKKVSDQWQEAIASDAVAGVLAGHLHDSHKEIYRQPYTWSTVNDQKTGFSKLYLAPPLSVKNQDASPIQARGFSLVGLTPEGIKYKIYWYNAEKGDFAPDQREEYGKRKWERHGYGWESMPGSVEEIVACVWKFLCPKSLDQSAILFIALLAAFLTVVQVWQIPEPENPLNRKTVTATAQATGGSPTASVQTSETKAAFDPSPFASNFGKTVITGLTGLAAETVLKSLEGKPTADDKEYYIVWFVIFFFLLLLGLALFRAIVEAIRSRIAIIYYPLPPRRGSSSGGSGTGSGTTSPDDPKGPKPRGPLGKIWDLLSYWALRIAHWLVSLKVPLLTLLDTFINLIQGKNQTNTRVFSETIMEQQRNVIRVAHVIRRQVHDVIFNALLSDSPLPEALSETPAQLTQVISPQPAGPQATQSSGENPQAAPATAPEKPPNQTSKKTPRPTPQDVRVNISVLSADQSKVFYIARSPGSSVKAFPKRSVAWVSVFTGKIRWFKRSYQDKDMLSKIVLFDNSSGVISDGEQKIYLQSNYQSRDDDYEAFVIFPVPFPQRGFGSRYVKGAIHISFRNQEEFERVWAIKEDPSLSMTAAAATTLPKQDLEYRFENKMIDDCCLDKQIQATLREAIAILGELLRGFNEHIYFSSPGGGECPE